MYLTAAGCHGFAARRRPGGACAIICGGEWVGGVRAGGCRFSSPTLRAWSIRFSKSLFMHMADDRLLLSMRVGNVRSKTILNPTAKMLLAMEIDKDDCDGAADGQPLCLVVRSASLLFATPWHCMAASCQAELGCSASIHAAVVVVMRCWRRRLMAPSGCGRSHRTDARYCCPSACCGRAELLLS